MSADRWGIVTDYEDTSHTWHETSPETRRAILAAMGVDDRSPEPDETEPLHVVYFGVASTLKVRGRLVLEDGTQLDVDGDLPSDLPLGYHTLAKDANPDVRIVCAPRQCVEPPNSIWGWAAQLYSSRSKQSWGIGDLADLRRLATWSAKQGAGCLLINPLNAVVPSPNQQPSPYSPTSRRFRNPLYLRVDEIPGAREALGDELTRVDEVGKALNEKPLIDRASVYRLKEQAFRKIWQKFAGDSAFDRYRASHGAALEQFATFCGLSEEHGGDWRTWPAQFRNPEGADVRTWVQQHDQRVAFHAWLQWLLDGQLASASKHVAILQDLPIGFDVGGADSWAWQHLLAHDVTVGAPPDFYNVDGQDWGLPPFVPHKLRAAWYQPFVETIRASLSHAGGLRIDHVMGLFRLFWIPRGVGPKAGTYVRYRAEELLAILALESHRAGAFVVGEDLGTVEPGVRETLAEHRVLSYRVLWFEDKPIREYPSLAMVSPGTHDLPTIAGLWCGSDLKDQQRIGMTDSDDSNQQLLHRLEVATGAKAQDSTETVIGRTYDALGSAPSTIVTASLEDALAIEKRVNMPGTIDQWPNWSIALEGGLEALEASPLAARIAKVLSKRAKNRSQTG